MKNILIILLIFILSSLGIIYYQNYSIKEKIRVIENKNSSLPRIAFVNMDLLYKRYKKITGAEESFKSVVLNLNKKIELKRNKLKEEVKILEKLGENLKELKKKKLRSKSLEVTKEIVKLSEKIKKDNSSNQEETLKIKKFIQSESLRINNELYNDIQSLIKKEADKSNLNYVINLNAKDTNGVPVVLYSYKPEDITGRILNAFNIKKPSNKKIDNSKSLDKKDKK